MAKAQVANSNQRESSAGKTVAKRSALMDRIRLLRTDNQMSQEELARLLGASWPSVSRWERGLARPTEDSVVRMERLLEVEKRIKPALREGAFKRFLFAPHPMLDNFPPADLLQSGYSFQRLLGFVENALGGDVS